MVKDLRNDPIFEKKEPPPREPLRLNKDVLLKYKGVVDGIILFRGLLAAPIAALIFLIFRQLDVWFYPEQAAFFFKLRILAAVLLFASMAIAIWKRKYIVWFVDAILLIMASQICLMIYLTNGASSHYYEGLNTLILGLLLVNGFYVRHNLVSCLLILGMYWVAALSNQAGWNLMKFCFATYFVGSTAFFIVLMTKFYSTQHFDAFIRNEELKEDERKLQILYEMAEEKAKIDDLTKIYNRGYFFEILAAKINACRRANSFFYLIIFDIDHFKEINDNYGHVFGDQTIATVAKTVQNAMRMNSYIGRYGGDEFMLIIDKASQKECLFRLQTIRQAIRSLDLVCDGKPVSLSASFGVARWEPEMMDEKKLIELADSVLLEVKRTKRGEILLAN